MTLLTPHPCTSLAGPSNPARHCGAAASTQLPDGCVDAKTLVNVSLTSGSAPGVAWLGSWVMFCSRLALQSYTYGTSLRRSSAPLSPLYTCKHPAATTPCSSYPTNSTSQNVGQGPFTGSLPYPRGCLTVVSRASSKLCEHMGFNDDWGGRVLWTAPLLPGMQLAEMAAAARKAVDEALWRLWRELEGATASAGGAPPSPPPPAPVAAAPAPAPAHVPAVRTCCLFCVPWNRGASLARCRVARQKLTHVPRNSPIHVCEILCESPHACSRVFAPAAQVVPAAAGALAATAAGPSAPPPSSAAAARPRPPAPPSSSPVATAPARPPPSPSPVAAAAPAPAHVPAVRTCSMFCVP
jgi:hypothetical protein